jgi:putative ABC transport system ATP-binding protein
MIECPTRGSSQVPMRTRVVYSSAMTEPDKIAPAAPSAPPLLDGADFRMAAGEFVILEGPSGCGKSSLLRLLARFEEPWAGEILFEGRPLAEHPPALLRRRLHWVPQTPVMFEGTVRDNLRFPFRLHAGSGAEVPPDAELARRLEALKVARGLDARAAELSAGEKQRVALVRALLLGPRALLLDEPSAALDPESRGLAEDLAEEANLGQGIAILMVTHQDHAPRRAPHRRVRMEGGLLREVQQ